MNEILFIVNAFPMCYILMNLRSQPLELGYTPCSRCKPPTYSASISNNETPSTRSNEISVEDDKIAIDKSSFIWFASGCRATIIIRKIIKIFQGD